MTLRMSRFVLPLVTALVLCVLALLAPLPGCAGSGHVKIAALKTPYFEIDITISWDVGDEDYCLWGQFLDKDGNPMGSEVGGSSSGTMSIPQGAASIKYRIVECDEDQDSLGPAHPIHPAQLGWCTAGIVSVEELRSVGAVAAYFRAKQVERTISLNLLWALEGALTGAAWQQVAREHRASLLLALDNYERGI